jgi:lipid-A-disaccharide synthase
MHVFFSVGEPSGDQHAARLIEELRRRMPDLRVSGFGGPLMEEAGFKSHYRLTDLAVMGIFRVIPLLWRFYALVRKAGRILQQERPDVVVLVDFPGFNWWIARKAKKLGVRVIYYLPPQLWAWAPWRIKRVRRFVDHVLCGLSFEQRWYEEQGVSAEYVGHPFFDQIQEHCLDKAFLEAWKTSDQRNVGVLPGSRHHEIAQNWPIMVACIRRLAARHPNTRFLVACYSATHREQCRELLHEADERGPALPIHFFVGKTPEVIQVADCCLMVSGSVSLEMLARTTPAVVIYYWGWISGLLVRLLVTCKFCSLPNLMVDRKILPEFFPQGDGAPVVEQVTAKLSSWLADDSELDRVGAELKQLRAEVLQTGATARAAEAIVRRLQPIALERAA